jgi:hypothetical protein
VIAHSVVSWNKATTLGAGILNGRSATASISDSEIGFNTANINGGGYGGGGIANEGAADVANSSLHDNAADSGGGASNTGTLRIARSMVRDNSALGSSGFGGGLYNGASMEVTDSHVMGNRARTGGGIYTGGPDSRLTVTRSTVAANTAIGPAGGGGIFNLDSVMLLIDAFVAGNSPDDCVGCT